MSKTNKSEHTPKVSYQDLSPRFGFKGKERDIEAHVLDNINDISIGAGWGKVRAAKSQVRLPSIKGRSVAVDIVVYHTYGTITVIEVKKHRPDRSELMKAITQVLFYGTLIERKFKVLPRMVVASNVISDELFEVCDRFSFPVDVLMIDGDRVISIPHKDLTKLVRND